MNDFLTLQEAAKLLGVTYRTLARYVQTNRGPKIYRLPGNDVRIRRDDFLLWLEGLAERPAA